MQTRANFEKVILKEIRELPGEALPKVLKILCQKMEVFV